MEEISYPSVFVIVVTYNGRKWYDRCFSSLRQSEVPIRVVVIDNSSSDGTVDYLRTNFPEIYLIESNENLGFGRANNIGLRYALDNGCQFVFLLNQDAAIEPTTLKLLIDIYSRHPGYGILSPMHLNGEKNHLNILFSDGEPRQNYELISDLFCNCLKDIYDEIYINAAAWLLPRQTLEIVGGFDPAYVHYEEDDDYINRVVFHKLKIGLCPKVRIIHDHTNLENPFKKQNNRYRHEQELRSCFSNPNQNSSILNYICFLFRKVITLSIKGQFSLAKDVWADLSFLIANKKSIKYSRLNNSLRQPSWL